MSLKRQEINFNIFPYVTFNQLWHKILFLGDTKEIKGLKILTLRYPINKKLIWYKICKFQLIITHVNMFPA